MTTLIKLQFRKNLLGFAVLLGALLASVPLALAVKGRAMSPREAVNLAMFFWGLAGLPLSTLFLAGLAGAEAAGEQARAAEQTLPVSQYKLLVSGVLAAVAQAFALALAAFAILGFSLPLESLTKAQELTARFYVFLMIYLPLYAFTLGYAFRNAVAGALLGGAAAAGTLIPLTSAAIFQSVAFPLVPLWALVPLIGALTLGGAALALRLFSKVHDRRSSGKPALAAAAAALLAAPLLSAWGTLVLVNVKARPVTQPVSEMFFPLFGVDRNLLAAAERENAGSLLLAQRPFYGEVFFLDAQGGRAELVPPSESREAGFTYLFPDLRFTSGETMATADGSVWAMYSYGRGGRLARGTMKDGFRTVAELPRTWSMHLLGGRSPGLLDRRDDGYYFSPLPDGARKTEWRKVASLEEGLMKFLGDRYLADGRAARLSPDGARLLYKGRSWAVPGALKFGSPFPGAELADGMYFFVPAKGKDGYFTYVCRPDGKAEAAWPDYYRLTQNLEQTPDGAIWGVRMNEFPKGKDRGFTLRFNVLAGSGKTIRELNIDDLMARLDAEPAAVRPLHSDGTSAWFDFGGRWLVKTAVGAPQKSEYWELPRPAVRRTRFVKPSMNGVFVTARDGVYFMDWEGRSKKLF